MFFWCCEQRKAEQAELIRAVGVFEECAGGAIYAAAGNTFRAVLDRRSGQSLGIAVRKEGKMLQVKALEGGSSAAAVWNTSAALEHDVRLNDWIISVNGHTAVGAIVAQCRLKKKLNFVFHRVS